MIDTKELRRLTQEATPGPWKMLPVGDGRQKFAVADSEFLSILTVTDEGGATFGTVYDDDDARFIAAANPTTVSELLDRLEAAESDALEQARLNGTGSEREAALMAKLEAAEKWRDDVAMQLAQSEQGKRKISEECDELRARIEAMERQKPVAWMDDGTCRSGSEATAHRVVTNKTKRDMPTSVAASFSAPLYLAPGAQPAPSVPEGWKLVPIEPTYEMLEAGEGALVPTYTDTPVSVPFDVYRAMLAAAPEAKPCP